MAKAFMDQDFLLSSDMAKRLYHDFAEKMPIIDFHCHVSPREIYEDRVYENIAQLFLGKGTCGDHYKWRLIRACGESENLITGEADDYQRFLALARTMPQIMGNPVYHWTHLELKRYFNCDQPLNEDTALAIWDRCNQKLRAGFSVRKIIEQSRVTGLATTDDPVDTLEWHEKIAADPTIQTVVRPTWRADRVLNIQKPDFADYLSQLGEIADMDSLRAALRTRMDYFAHHGCAACDHGLEFLEAVSASEYDLNAILAKGIHGQKLTHAEAAAYQYACMLFLGEEYAKRRWVMEIHFGTVRNVNAVQLGALGADTGYDVISPSICVSGLPMLLDTLNSRGALPKTVLFPISANDNAMVCTLCAAFQREGTRGWVQQGAAWWFNDSMRGMLEQMTTMASLAPIGNFLGMVTDSRSFLSYTRHEYFRRILCDLLGRWVENGEYPADMERLGQMVQDVSYNNVKNFFEY